MKPAGYRGEYHKAIVKVYALLYFMYVNSTRVHVYIIMYDIPAAGRRDFSNPII